jgi:hypothetical protein
MDLQGQLKDETLNVVLNLMVLVIHIDIKVLSLSVEVVAKGKE